MKYTVLHPLAAVALASWLLAAGSALADDGPPGQAAAAAETAHASPTADPLAPANTAPVDKAPLVVPAERLGYAHGNPQILLHQRLFGIAHGISMLAAACLDLSAHSMPVQDAYAAWHQRQAGAIEALVRKLSTYYFGKRADEAGWSDLSAALNLKQSIFPSLGGISLEAACASLPQVLTMPRYDFVTLLAEPASTPEAGSDPAPQSVAQPVPQSEGASLDTTPAASPMDTPATTDTAPATP